MLFTFIILLIVFIKKFLLFGITPNANNLGTFLGGLGTFGLLIIGVFGIFYFKRWKDEKKFEKRSDIAGKSLDDLDVFKNKILNWINLSQSFLVYDRTSEANSAKYCNATEEEKKELNKMHDNNSYEIHNFIKEGYEILAGLIHSKNYSWRLNNNKINENFDLLEKTTRNILLNVKIKYFVNSTKDDRTKACKELSFAQNAIEQILSPIYEELRKYLMFD